MLLSTLSFESPRSSGDYDHSQTPTLTSTSDGIETGLSDSGDTSNSPPNLSSPQGSLSKLDLRDHTVAPNSPLLDRPGVDICPSSTPFDVTSLSKHPYRTGDCDPHGDARTSPALPELAPIPSSPCLSVPYRATPSTISSALHASLNPRLAEILATPDILRLVLANLSWEEFSTFVKASSALHGLFDLGDVASRDVVLARFVSGFAMGQRHDDGDIIGVSLGDLEELSK